MDQHRIMLTAYLRGLRDRHIVERLVREGRPNTFEEAITLVERYTSDDYALQRALGDTIPRRNQWMLVQWPQVASPMVYRKR